MKFHLYLIITLTLTLKLVSQETHELAKHQNQLERLYLERLDNNVFNKEVIQYNKLTNNTTYKEILSEFGMFDDTERQLNDREVINKILKKSQVIDRKCKITYEEEYENICKCIVINSETYEKINNNDSLKTASRYHFILDTIANNIIYIFKQTVKQINKDGIFLDYNEISYRKSLSNNSFLIYPNPTTQKTITIEYYASKKEMIKIIIYNSQGIVIRETAELTNKGQNIFKINFEDDVFGVYFIKIITSTKNNVQKIILN